MYNIETLVKSMQQVQNEKQRIQWCHPKHQPPTSQNTLYQGTAYITYIMCQDGSYKTRLRFT